MKKVLGYLAWIVTIVVCVFVGWILSLLIASVVNNLATIASSSQSNLPVSTAWTRHVVNNSSPNAPTTVATTTVIGIHLVLSCLEEGKGSCDEPWFDKTDPADTVRAVLFASHYGYLKDDCIKADKCLAAIVNTPDGVSHEYKTPEDFLRMMSQNLIP